MVGRRAIAHQILALTQFVLLIKPWVGWMGLATVPLWLVGQSELLATAIPTLQALETTPIAFILWELWLLVVGVSLLRVPSHRIRDL